MSAEKKSCAVASPIQRNCATQENHATTHATLVEHVRRKPASIQELRAQLRAQQGRNQRRNHVAVEAPDVAHASALFPQVAQLRSLDDATTQLTGDSGTVAGPYTPYCPARPAADWLAMLAELNTLIDLYCMQEMLSAEARGRILDACRHQSLASIPASIQFFHHVLTGRAVQDKSKVKE